MSLDALTALWTSLLLESTLPPLEAVQCFSTSLLLTTAVNHLDNALFLLCNFATSFLYAFAFESALLFGVVSSSASGMGMVTKGLGV